VKKSAENLEILDFWPEMSNLFFFPNVVHRNCILQIAKNWKQ